MADRQQVIGLGEIVKVRETGRVYDVKMPNGYVAIAVIPKDGPDGPEHPINLKVEVEFSPYDMSRSKILSWLTED